MNDRLKQEKMEHEALLNAALEEQFRQDTYNQFLKVFSNGYGRLKE